MNYFEKRLFLIQKSKEGWTGEIEIDKPKWMAGDTTARSNVWYCKFKKGKSYFGRVIDFNIFLTNGSLLTDIKNDHLLWVIKLFIIFQVHPKFLKRLDVGGITQSDYITKALLFVDWVLIHDNVFDVVNNGFALFTADSIKLYLVKYTSPPVTENLYRLSKHLSDWLKPKILTVTSENVSAAAAKWPGLSDLPDPEERQLDLTDAEIIKARVFILKANMYVAHNGGVRFNSKAFIAEEYRNTLLGTTINFKIPNELTWGCVRRREYAMIPVRNPSRPGLTSQVIRDHIRVIKYLTIVDSYIKTGIDAEKVTGLSMGAVRPHIQEKSNDRYRLLPYEIVFYAIKKAMSFKSVMLHVYLKH